MARNEKDGYNQQRDAMKKILCVLITVTLLQAVPLRGFSEICCHLGVETLAPHTRFVQEPKMAVEGDKGYGMPVTGSFEGVAALLYARDLMVHILVTNGPTVSEKVVKKTLSRHMGNIAHEIFDPERLWKEEAFFLPFVDPDTGREKVMKFSLDTRKKTPSASDILIEVVMKEDIVRDGRSPLKNVRLHEGPSDLEREIEKLKRRFEYIEEEISGITFGWFLQTRNIIATVSSYEDDTARSKEIRHALHKYFPLKRKLILHFASRKRIRNVLRFVESIEKMRDPSTSIDGEMEYALHWLKQIDDPVINSMIKLLPSDGPIDITAEVRGDLIEIIGILESGIRVLSRKTETILSSLKAKHFAEDVPETKEIKDSSQMDIFVGREIDLRGIKRASRKVTKVLGAIPGLEDDVLEIYEQRYFNLLRLWKKLYGQVDGKYFRDKSSVHIVAGSLQWSGAVDRALGMDVSVFKWERGPLRLHSSVEAVILEDYSEIPSGEFKKKILPLFKNFAEKGLVFFDDGLSRNVDVFIEEAALLGIKMTKEIGGMPSFGEKKGSLYSFQAEYPFKSIDKQMDLLAEPARPAAPLVEEKISLLADAIREKAIMLREQGRVLFIGIDTSWIPDGKKDMSGVNTFLRGMERMRDIYGLDNIIVKCAPGEDLGNSLSSVISQEEKERRYSHRLSDVFIIGSSDILLGSALRGFRPGEEDGASFALISLKGNVSLDSYISFGDIIRAAVLMSYGNIDTDQAETPHIRVRRIENRKRSFIFEIIPDAQKYPLTELNDRYRRELEILIRL